MERASSEADSKKAKAVRARQVASQEKGKGLLAFHQQNLSGAERPADFLEQKGQLQETVEAKFHCELNFIEMF